MSDNSDDDDVGYGKPPKHTQFAKGESGNVKGRPRKPKHVDPLQLVSRIVSELVPIKVKGRRRKLRAIEILTKQALQKALGGDINDLTKVLKLAADLQVQDDAVRMRLARVDDDERDFMVMFVDVVEIFEVLRLAGAVIETEEGRPQLQRGALELLLVGKPLDEHTAVLEALDRVNRRRLPREISQGARDLWNGVTDSVAKENLKVKPNRRTK